MNPVNNMNFEDKNEKLLMNGLLFVGLRGHDRIVDKVTNLEKVLKKGADINASDANDCNNTPLHIAVEKDEAEIVEFLLRRGANPNAKNNGKKTPMDLATLSNKTAIINILKAEINLLPNLIKSSEQVSKEEMQKPSNIQLKITEVNAIKKTALSNESRPGTAGISGQLYESKLIGLLLHRALNDHTISKFYLGSNIDGLGALDDIVFKYYLRGESSPKIFFLQAKHKDNPAKDKLTVDSVLKTNNDFGLDKYFRSYMDIRKKIVSNKCRHNIFQKDFNHFDCRFIIYTTAFEHFNQKKSAEVYGKETLISTNDKVKPFLFDYNNVHVETVLKNTVLSRTKSLAKIFAENISRHKYKNMMFNELIKVYHIYLAQNIVKIRSCNGESEDYNMGSFRKSFLTSQDDILVYMKKTMFKELKLSDKLSYDSNEITLEFKLPKIFGNTKVPFNENNNFDLCRIIEKLIKLGKKKDNIIIITVDDDMVGTNKLIQGKDITLIGQFVGETLILDDVTGVLKFNTEHSYSDITKRFLEKWKSNGATEIDLKMLRLDITVHNFPQLSLHNSKPMNQMLTDFLNRLIFYTNQENEEGVEVILKREINEKYNSEYKTSDNFYHIKSDAIYLQYHDKIQKWWKHPKIDYLTKSCQFYDEAKKEILDSPILNIYNFIYVKKLDTYNLNFSLNAVHSLGLQKHMNNPNILLIPTQDKLLTSIKIIQYFRFIDTHWNYKFIDLDVVTAEDYNKFILSELSQRVIDVIIIVLSDTSNLINFDLQNIQKVVNKLIIISNSSSELLTTTFQCLEQIDQNNSLGDLDSKTKHRICDLKNILFQGLETSLFSIVNEHMQSFVKGKVLHKIINNTTLKIGKEPTNINDYYKNKELYTKRSLCRCLELSGEQYLKEFKCFFDPNDMQIEIEKRTIFENNKDIVIISNDNASFEKSCEVLSHVNIHWFYRKNGKILWNKSYGNSLREIYRFVKRVKCNEDHCLPEPKSLKHMNDRVVVISAWPGMGKSTLFTHMMMQTKYLYKSMCVLKLNLLDLKNAFSNWQTYDDEQRLEWILSLMFKSFSIYDCDKNGNSSDENLPNSYIDKETYLDSNGSVGYKNEDAYFEYQVFSNLYENGKICLLLDGFDEICPDYKKEAIEFFKVLINSQLCKLWISSRSYLILDELEYVLNTFSYTLKSLALNEQIDFLKKFWGINCFERASSYIIPENNINLYVTQFFDAISRKINTFDNKFTGTPLHLRMIAETYQDYFKDFCFSSPSFSIRGIPQDHFSLKIIQYQFSLQIDEYLLQLGPVFNLMNLYEKFIEIKFYKIRFCDKKTDLDLKDPDIKMTLKRELRLFIENHKKLAAYALLTKDNEVGMLTSDDVKQCSDLIQRFNLGEEKTGIIEKIVQNEPIFVHFTYAEYFTCEFICDKLRQPTESTCKYFVQHILVMDNGGIRRFINDKLENDQILLNLTSEHISDALLMQKQSTKSALYSVILENHNNIANFLLNNLDTYANNDIIDFVARHFLWCIHNQQSEIFMKKIIHIIKRLDCSKLVQVFFYENNPVFNVFVLAFLRQDQSGNEIYGVNKENMDILLEHTNPDDLTKLFIVRFWDFNYTILHILLMKSKNLYVLKYVENLNHEQRLKVFYATDVTKEVPAHVAARANNLEFFEIMENLVGNEHFRAICNLKNGTGSIPFVYLSDNTRNSERFKSLFAKSGIGFASTLYDSRWYWYNTKNPKEMYLLYDSMNF